LIRTLGHIRDLENEIAVLKEDRRRFAPESMMHSETPEMRRIIETLQRAALSEAIILLRGESGTGKSIFARTIHNWSPRAKKPMMIVSCPAVPNELLESELFGHARGAFTGAVNENPGRIAACEGGGRCFWTRSATWPCRPRPSCCALSRTRNMTRPRQIKVVGVSVSNETELRG